jgi:hypothetical protein
MRLLQSFVFVAILVVIVGNEYSVEAQTPKDKSKVTPKETIKEAPTATEKETAAQITRTKLLKAKVSGKYKEVRLGDILKEFANQVDMQGDQPVMWAYGPGFPYSQKVTYSCEDLALDTVLDQLLTKADGGLGYVVVSKEGDKYDGWVRLTTTGERGLEKGAATPAEEAAAAKDLTTAKRLIELGKPAAAKPVLEILVRKYSNTKAGAEAKELLEKIDK